MKAAPSTKRHQTVALCLPNLLRSGRTTKPGKVLENLIHTIELEAERIGSVVDADSVGPTGHAGGPVPVPDEVRSANARHFVRPVLGLCQPLPVGSARRQMRAQILQQRWRVVVEEIAPADVLREQVDHDALAMEPCCPRLLCFSQPEVKPC